MSDITQAVGAPLQRHVMPCAEVPVHPRQGRLWANVRPIGAETSVPSYPLDDLYDQAALDAAVAAERERLVPLSFAQLDEAAREAQIKFCLKGGRSFEEEFARAIERAHGIGA